eukprot:CAMPEP_0198714804 /NCGR_PEP_ID=MMETSP1471-20131121/24543_1 /TAXON_ID=41880 /ORGANISM="Pycnococcus provasolii, Strain RCC733" /LENGTH=176 /DNA_ID=CAMNT_0044475145 /DNA_START=77 /DNA_END=607 /DNA_ORIENTATION=-
MSRNLAGRCHQVSSRCHSRPVSATRTRFCSSGQKTYQRLQTTRVLASSNDSEQESSKEILDAFFLGKAVAETISERIGDTIGEVLAEVARTDAERRRFVRELQEEVQARARGELMDSVEATAPPPPPTTTTTPQSPPPAATAAAPPAEDLKSVAARARGELNDATEDKSSKDDDEE